MFENHQKSQMSIQVKNETFWSDFQTLSNRVITVNTLIVECQHGALLSNTNMYLLYCEAF